MIDDKLYQKSECGEYYSLKPEHENGYRKASDEQLAAWLEGKPTHNVYLAEVSGDPSHAECCPDFSCCGSPMWSQEMRKAFAEADTLTRTRMCMEGLPAALASLDPTLPEIHIAVGEPDRTMH